MSCRRSGDRATLLALAEANMAQLADAPRPDPAPYEAYAPSAGLRIETLAIASQPDGNSINLQVIRPEGPGPLALRLLHSRRRHDDCRLATSPG